MRPVTRVAQAAVVAGTVASLAGTARAVTNMRRLLVPDIGAVQRGTEVRERVSVLLPVRDEAPRVAACLRALLASRGRA